MMITPTWWLDFQGDNGMELGISHSQLQSVFFSTMFHLGNNMLIPKTSLLQVNSQDALKEEMPKAEEVLTAFNAFLKTNNLK